MDPGFQKFCALTVNCFVCLSLQPVKEAPLCILLCICLVVETKDTATLFDICVLLLIECLLLQKPKTIGNDFEMES